ncbi:hypothetical protein [Burkholderia gladioli]|uniref:hypothetical protein n=1 Tax=Burkholderia gladioli TaxID=28095 RepID=UPI0016405C66|nr:hypothetical protein [Burkholderia gladioli]MDN7754758.1 hypothetical protein [Burkholderia gladioli]
MDWLPALLKHLAIARSAVLAVFVTSAVMLIGPRIGATVVPPTPSSWAPIAFAMCLFSGCLLAIWIIEAVWSAAKSSFGAAKASRGARAPLDKLEMSVIYTLGCNPAEPLDLDVIDYATSPSTRLELMEVVNGLSKKGLVETNPWSAQLVSLTDDGRKRALEIHRMQTSRESE